MFIKRCNITLIFTLIITLFVSIEVYSQTTYKTETYTFSRNNQRKISEIGEQWFVNIQNIDTVFQGNDTYHSHLRNLKKQIELHDYSFIHNSDFSTGRLSVDSVEVPQEGYAFEGNIYNGSVPNDNTVAISNDGIVVAAINTNIIFYDIKTDSLLKQVSLSQFSDTLTTVSKHQYDPKAIYDFVEDRFILVYLAGSGSDPTTDIIVAFSESSDPLGNWNFYHLPGDAVNDTSWSDYPAISLNDNELIITINLLQHGGSWQTSFRQSVVWQVDKFAGYKGDSIKSKLFYDIKYKGNNIRNIHPARGGDQYYGPEVYLLSNLNFALETDTFFLMKITDKLNVPSSELKVDLMVSDIKYGMPPNAMQASTKRLATNDARVLGAFYQNGEIQFVGNSLHIVGSGTNNKYAGFYHGVIKTPSTAPNLHLQIYSDKSKPLMEYGYPNISYCGTNAKSQHSIITVNYSAKDTFPGFGAIFFERDSVYSKLKNLKSGNTDIYILWGTQRWGDYSGSQPKYDEPGKVWACGTFGKIYSGKRAYGTWITELASPVEDDPIEIIPQDFSAKAYPNPPENHQIKFEFDLPKNEIIQVEIIDISGRIVALLYDTEAKAGKNILNFSTIPLDNGLYIVRIRSGNKLLYSQKITVVQ
ncbi:MAG: hypothetical protein DRI84_06330 [Bacteroidetes bacterium]|nr:MAG: hypothetical protein DRI84_06330 [Bacteroidota bacterium]